MKRFIRFLSYVVVALVACMVTVSLMNAPEPAATASYSKLAELEKLITTRFIGEADTTVMEDAAAEAMVDSLGDRWSYYISAAEYASYTEQMANAYVGIGITIELRDEGILVTKVNAGGSADEAGILPGDYIIKVNDKTVAGEGLEVTQQEVRGEEGTTVNITVLRDGREVEFIVERRMVMVDVATCKMLDEEIGYVQIVNFDSRCAEETIACIDKVVAQGAKAIVFDVRFNPGGYKDELCKVLDYLLPEGKLFQSVDYRGVENTDMSDANCLELPFAVLVNEDSYSAAEFFAAALREYEVGFIVGTPTCGKGYFQNTFQLSDGSAVGLSVGKYFTPNGVSLAGVGLTPEYTVEVDEDTYLAIYAGTLEPEEDIQLVTAWEAIKKEIVP